MGLSNTTQAGCCVSCCNVESCVRNKYFAKASRVIFTRICSGKAAIGCTFGSLLLHLHFRILEYKQEMLRSLPVLSMIFTVQQTERLSEHQPFCVLG